MLSGLEAAEQVETASVKLQVVDLKHYVVAEIAEKKVWLTVDVHVVVVVVVLVPAATATLC